MHFRSRWIALLLLPLPLTLAVACNTVSPDECWLNPTGGLGGADTIFLGQVGAGAGSVGSPAHHPLTDSDEPNPCITPGTPCDQKCLTDYESRAAGCGSMADAAARKVCQDDAYRTYKGCRATCATEVEAEESQCRKKCTAESEACESGCRKLPESDRRACWSNCNEEAGRCYKKCKK